ncbi:hypothetical protein [Capnocytophaga canimorsus]|uniref:hypothetical protein n=1 Tax=Capnocytophaga canimorsus TaxID=28188 RepID=UPI0028E8C4BB|nr:hypothetical protein [Capnocytophaga canimorsus]MDT9499155.1 hypothetical protein [Capnocytophaga canimorsus]
MATIKNFLSRKLYEVEPITAYLFKSETYVAGLYKGARLIGCMVYPPYGVEVSTLGKHIEDIFPKNLNDLELFMEKNKQKARYYENTDIVYFDENDNVIRDE